MTQLKSDHFGATSPIFRWWHRYIVESVDHQPVVERIIAESGWSPRYIFMTMMSAGIAVLGLLLSSPAVVIGAMLISPLMSPILGFGFSLALFDYVEMRRSLTALLMGASAAIIFTVLIVLASPLQATTAEIVARTRPSLFDLLVALFAALAGTFAIIRGRGETIVGVAIATALMPPLAVVGYGIATWNIPVLTGATALFFTNFVTISLAAMILARFYGFGHSLSQRQTWVQTILLFTVFIAMAVPLGFSLERIARESVMTNQVRSTIAKQLGENARVTQLDIDFATKPLFIRSVIIAPRNASIRNSDLRSQLQSVLGRSVRLQLDQVLLAPGADALAAQRAELRQTDATEASARAIMKIMSVAAGVDVEQVTLDHDQRRMIANAKVLPGATLESYWALEQRLAAVSDGWEVMLIPPMSPMPSIRFASGSDTLDAEAARAVLISGWAALRWNIPALAVPGLPLSAGDASTLSERRGLAVANILREQEVRVVSAATKGPEYKLVAMTEAER